MACRFEVTLCEGDAVWLDAARAALDEADRVESLLTAFRPSSEISRVNREAYDGAAAVDEELWALLRRCVDLHAATAGTFDITAAPLSRCWGFLRREGCVPSNADIESARSLVGMPGVRFHETGREIRFARSGMELNLGAIGKGYALDRMAVVLRRLGVRRALVSAGSSSVRALGAPSGGWPIDLRSPQVRRQRLARIYVRDGALGTSGPGEQFIVADGVRYGHVIDPRNGWPAQGVLSASAITADATRADALSTAFLVGGPALAGQYCRDHPDTLALLTLDDGSERPCVFGSYAGAALED
jgi:thiamine biosynthesis lipoprotein